MMFGSEGEFTPPWRMIRKAIEADVGRIVAIAHAAYAKYVPRIGREPLYVSDSFLKEKTMLRLTRNGSPLSTRPPAWRNVITLLGGMAVTARAQQFTVESRRIAFGLIAAAGTERL